MSQLLKVLIVEDSADDAEMVVLELRHAGFEPDWLRVDTEAAFLEHLNRALDLVLSDFQMPAFNGLRALELLKQSGLDVPFILVSGTIGEETAVEAIRKGANDYLMKDRLARLGAAVTNVLEETRLRRERRQADESLRTVHGQLSQLLEHSPAVLYALKLVGDKIVPHLVSEGVKTLLGFTSSEASSYEWWHGQLHPDDRERAVRSVTETIELGANRTEYRLRHKDGHYCWVDDARRLIRDATGAPIEIIGVWTDITERRRAEDVLHQATESGRRQSPFGSRKDLAAVVLVSVLIFGLAFAFDLFEGPLELMIKHKDSAVDDFGGTLVVLTPLFMVFAHRRWQDARLAMRERRSALQERRPVAVETIRHGQQRARRELAALVAILVVMTSLAAWVNLFEQPFQWMWDNRNTPIDELLGSLLVVGVLMIPASFTFAYRRGHEIDALVDEHQQSVVALRLLHDELDKQVQLRTAELAKVNDALRAEVAERRRAESIVRVSEHRLREMLANLELIAMTLDQKGLVTFCNDFLLRLTGWKREEVIGQLWFDRFLPDSAAKEKPLFLSTIGSGTLPRHHQNPIKTRTGELREIVWSNTVLRDGAGDIVGSASIGEDITERARAEAALRESEAQFRQVVENIGKAVSIYDPVKKQLLYISPAYEKIWGQSCASLYDAPRSWLDAIHPEDRARIQQADHDKKAAGTYDEEYRITRPDGSLRWVHDRAFLVHNATEGIHRLVGVAEDITERRQMNEHLLQAQKMEALGQFSGGVAHDFNNILAAVGGYTELSRLQLTGNPEVRENLDAVLQASARAADLVRQILTFSRRQTTERQIIQLQPVVTESLKLMRATLPTTIEFDLSIAADTPTVLANANQIHQVLMNLGINASHAMKDRTGRLHVTLEKYAVTVKEAALHQQLQPGVYARVSVRDTGSGMDAATLRRIFEPFFTTKPVGEGTGLGLSMVHGIMDTHDGAVTVESTPGQGTVFRLYFPAHGGEEANATAEATSVPRGQGQRILVVDDEELLAQLSQKTLIALGYTAEFTTKPLEALARVQADPSRFALVLTDQAMPGMTGLVFANQLQHIRAGLPILLMTGNGLPLLPEQINAAGIRQLLLKPATLQSLGVAVHAALATPPALQFPAGGVHPMAAAPSGP